MDLISSQPVSVSTPRSSRSRVSNFFNLKKSSSSKDLSVLYHGPLSPPPSAVQHAWSPSNSTLPRFGKSTENPEYAAGDQRANGASMDWQVEREREREGESPRGLGIGIGIAFPSSPRSSPTPDSTSRFNPSSLHKLAGMASGSIGLPTAYVHGGNSPLFSNQTFLPASMTSPPIASPARENHAGGNINHHNPGSVYTDRGHNGGYSYPASVPMSHSNSNDYPRSSRQDPNQTTTTSASIRTNPSFESGDRSTRTSMTSLRTYPSVPDLRNKQRVPATHGQSHPQSQLQPNHAKNVSFSSIKNQPVSKPPLLSPISPSQASTPSASNPTSTPSLGTPNHLQVQQRQREIDSSLQEAQRRFLLLQQLHLDELTAHSVEASGWLEPGNGCEAVFAPRPRLRNSLDSSSQKLAPRTHSKSMSDVGRSGAARQQVRNGQAQAQQNSLRSIPNFERNRPVGFTSLRARSASNPNPHSTFINDAHQVLPPVPRVPGRDASLRSSHARANNGIFSYDADQERPFFHHRMPPMPPEPSKKFTSGRTSSGARSSQSRRKSSPAPPLFSDPQPASHVEAVLAEGKALDQEREQWRRQHQKSFGSSAAVSLDRRSKSKERSHSRNSANPIRARDIWNLDDHQQPQDPSRPIPVQQMNNVAEGQITEMRINDDRFQGEISGAKGRRVRPVKSSPQLGASASAEKDWGTSAGRGNANPSPPVPRGLCILPTWMHRPSPTPSRPTSPIGSSEALSSRRTVKSHGRSRSHEAVMARRESSGSAGMCGGYLSRKKRSSQTLHRSPPGSPAAHHRVHMAAQRRYKSSGSWDVAVADPNQSPVHLTTSRKSLSKGRESRILEEPVPLNRSSVLQGPTFKDQATSPGIRIEPQILSFPANQEQVKEELLHPVMNQAESETDRKERSPSVTPSESSIGIALASPSPATDSAFDHDSNENEKTPTRQSLQKIRAGRHPTSVEYKARTSSDLRALARGGEASGEVFLRSKGTRSDSSPTNKQSSLSRGKALPLNTDLDEKPLVFVNSQRPLRYQRSFELLPPLELKRASSSASGDFPKNPESLPVPPRKQRSFTSLAQKAGLSVETERSSTEILEKAPFQTPTLPANEERFRSDDYLSHPRNISDDSALSAPVEEPRPDSEVIPATDGITSPIEKRSPTDEESQSDLGGTDIRRSQSRTRKALGHSAASSISSATQAGSVAPRERWIVDDEGSENDGSRYENLWFRTPHSPIFREVSQESAPEEGASLRRRRNSDVVAQLVKSSLQSSNPARVDSAYDPSLVEEGSKDSWRMGRFDHHPPDRRRLQSHGSMVGEVGSIAASPSPNAPLEAAEPPHFAFNATPTAPHQSTPKAPKHQPKASVSSTASFIDMEEESGDTSGESPVDHHRLVTGVDSEGDVLRDYQHCRTELLSPEPAPHSRASGADYFNAENPSAESQIQPHSLPQESTVPGSSKKPGSGRWPDSSTFADGSEWF